MKLIDNLKTRTKLIANSSASSLITITLVIVGLYCLFTLNQGIQTIYFDGVVPLNQIKTVNVDLANTRGDIYRYLVVPTERAQLKAAIAEKMNDIASTIEDFSSTNLSHEEEVELSAYREKMSAFQSALDEYFRLVDSGNDQAALASLGSGGKLLSARQALSVPLNKLQEINSAIMEQSVQSTARVYDIGRITLVAACFLSLFLGILFTIVITRSITMPLKVMTDILVRLSDGDISFKVDNSIDRKDELGIALKALLQTKEYLEEMAAAALKISENNLTVVVTSHSANDELGNAFKKMVTNLKQVIGQISDTANHLAGASNQLASASNQAAQATDQIAATMQQVAKGTSQQSESISRTAQSADQMGRAIDGVAKGAQDQSTAVARASQITATITSAIQQIAANSEKSAELASTAAQNAHEGVETVQRTIRGMQTIKDKVGVSAEKVREMGQRSDQIGIIVETIDDIASQTNLLALNAAIEAARAGEHGKGFAVVADEVRKLAERSSIATKEIANLVRGIQQTVADAVKAMDQSTAEIELGVDHANQSDGALKNILAAAETVSHQVEEITQAAKHINTSSNELVASVDSVSAVVEENTAATEEMSANSSEVTQAMESIASVSEENSAAVEEVSASTEEMSAQAEEVSASAQELNGISQTLQDIVSKFAI